MRWLNVCATLCIHKLCGKATAAAAAKPGCACCGTDEAFAVHGYEVGVLIHGRRIQVCLQLNRHVCTCSLPVTALTLAGAVGCTPGEVLFCPYKHCSLCMVGICGFYTFILNTSAVNAVTDCPAIIAAWQWQATIIHGMLPPEH